MPGIKDLIEQKTQKEIEARFKLTSTIRTSNMNLFDADGKIKKYESPEQSIISNLRFP